jgi:phage shock protein PspC (stress-responsive transcriptional regulator)
VCGGLGVSLGIDPTIIRALWVFGSLMSIGIGLLLYIILAVVLPERTIMTEDI